MVRRLAVASLAAALISTPATATEVLEIPLIPNRPLTVRWKQPVTDADLSSPSGYFPADPPAARLVESVRIKNLGPEVTNPILWINGTAYLTPSSAFDALGLPQDADVDAIYQRWIDRRIHASTELDANDHALEIFRTFGASFCGEGSKAWAELIVSRGGSARMLRLTGHVVSEVTESDGSVVVDGDQNAFYVKLDNQMLASEEDLREDPFLIIRTKIYGRQMPFNLGASWMNASRIDRTLPVAKKAYRAKGSATQVNWSLLPGEQLRFFPDAGDAPVLSRSPDAHVAAKLRRAVLRVEIYPDTAARASLGNRMRLPYAVVGWTDANGVYHSVAEAGMEPRYEFEWRAQDPPKIIHCQAAIAQFPGFPLSVNSAKLETVTKDAALEVELTLSTKASQMQDLAPPRLVRSLPAEPGLPVYRVEASEALEKLWWQIAADAEFRRIVPNFDQVASKVDEVRPTSLLDATFFNPKTTYFVRAKGFANDRWSEWSDPISFEVEKPNAPTGLRIDGGSGEQARLSWSPTSGEVWVFASDRLDFLPEIYASELPVRIENNAIRKSEKNRNRILVVDGSAGFAEVEAFPFYRVVIHSNGIFSNPSRLLRHPAASVRKRATVLQNVHTPPSSDVATVTALSDDRE
jgi:hypothetical protein